SSSDQLSGHHSALTSFPTRRSSDLARRQEHQSLRLQLARAFGGCATAVAPGASTIMQRYQLVFHCRAQPSLERFALVVNGLRIRSEEHTSELQSREKLVCRLLLEKK